MKLIDGNIIDFTLEERGELGLYDVKMYVNMVPYIGVFSYYVGFIHSSFPLETEEDEKMLDYISNEIKKVLAKEI
jgi:hypothetical protein